MISRNDPIYIYQAPLLNKANLTVCNFERNVRYYDHIAPRHNSRQHARIFRTHTDSKKNRANSPMANAILA